MAKKKKKPSPEAKRQQELRKTILRIFKNSGFTYLPTRNKHKEFHGKSVEIDSAFVFENIIVFCEDSVQVSPSAHLVKSKETAQIIEECFDDVFVWLKNSYTDQFEKLTEYSSGRYLKFYLYFNENTIDASDERYDPLIIISPKLLKYLDIVSGAVRKSARFEIFRLLGLDRGNIGLSETGNTVNDITASIICPQDRTGLGGGVRAVSFMIDPASLLECGYVLRKDNWEDSTLVYQRLIEASRVKSIRQFVADTQQSFVNNIIVSLPRNIEFKDAAGVRVNLDDIQDYKKQYTLCMPKEYNSICIIDGQHRVFAYHEGSDTLESKISGLRSKLHLLVTGLVFPVEMNSITRAKFESQVFLEINSQSKKVSSEVIQYIEELKDAFSPTGVARRVLSGLNQTDLFRSSFQLSSLEVAPIKTISIIKFALNRLTGIDENNASSLYAYWNGDKVSLKEENREKTTAEEALNDYIKYCIHVLKIFFSALKKAQRAEWSDPESKILSAASINGFILTLLKTLPYYGVKDFEFYVDSLSSLKMSFKKASDTDKGFLYGSSRYNMMSDEVVRQCFPDVPLVAEQIE